MRKKLKVAILGTGNIGTDLLIKCSKQDFIEIVCFVGRRMFSDGIEVARKMGIKTSLFGIEYFKQHKNCCDVVFDCTNAADAKLNWEVFKEQNVKVIDMTPAKIGPLCVPDINPEVIIENGNVNMITCGGQASLPLLHLISKNCPNLEYIEVVSQIASKSAGMSTRINIDDYIYATSAAITKFTGCKNNKVIINLNPADPCVDMQTTIFFKCKNVNVNQLTDLIVEKIEHLKSYIPHYELVLPPTINNNDIIVLSVKIKGSGDYLPKYAGNLDIINCSAISVLKTLYDNNET